MAYIKNLLICITFFTLCACDLLDVHPYDCKVDGRKNINAQNILEIEKKCLNKDTVRYVWTGDFQRWYDETNDMVKFINKLDNIDFVMSGGDISDFGMTMEFELIDEIMKKLTVPYVSIIGNHDIIGNGYQTFKTMYGEENFSFIAGNTKFVCLNTNALEFDYSHYVPDFQFIKTELESCDENVKRTVMAMHTEPYGEQFNNNVADVFHEYIKTFPNLLFCMHAHAHTRRIVDIFDDEILYYCCDSVKKRTFYIFTITPDSYECELIEF